MKNKPALFAADKVYRFDSFGVSRTSFVSVGNDISFAVVSSESPSFGAVDWLSMDIVLLLLLLLLVVLLLGNFVDEVDNFVGLIDVDDVVVVFVVTVVVDVVFVGFDLITDDVIVVV